VDQRQPCVTDVSNPDGGSKVDATNFASGPNSGVLYESVNAQNHAQLNCGQDYTSYPDPNTYELNVTTTNREKIVTTTIVVPLAPPNITPTQLAMQQQICFGAPYEFKTADGSKGILPDGTSGFIGLLPDCPTSGTPSSPCIASRTQNLDPAVPLGFDIVVMWEIPPGLPGDPWGR
jgi:hypothetical protein